MTDRQPSAKPLQDPLCKDLADMPHAFMGVYLSAVAGDDPGALLSPMLLGVQTQVGKLGGFRVAVNGEDSTFVVKLIVKLIVHDPVLP